MVVATVVESVILLNDNFIPNMLNDNFIRKGTEIVSRRLRKEIVPK